MKPVLKRSHEIDNQFFSLFVEMTSRIAAALPETYGDVLADRAIEVSDVDFMKSLRLEDMAFQMDDLSGASFLMINRRSGLSMRLSNRDSANGEMRGPALRNLLIKRRDGNPDSTVYDVIKQVITSAESDVARYFFNSLRQDYTMEEQLVVKFYFKMILNRVHFADKFDFEKPVDQESVKRYYDLTVALYPVVKQLAMLKEKINDLEARGERKASRFAADLLTLLEGQTFYLLYDVIERDMGIQECLQNYQTQCARHISDARPTLEQHRGWKQFLADLACVLVSIVTLGTANLVSYATTGSLTFFKTETASAKIASQLDHAVSAVDAADFQAQG